MGEKQYKLEIERLKQTCLDLEEQVKILIKTEKKLHEAKRALDKEVRDYSVLQKIAEFIGLTFDVNEVFKFVIRNLILELSCEKAVFLMLKENEVFAAEFSGGYDAGFADRLRVEEFEITGLLAEVFHLGNIIVNDYNSDFSPEYTRFVKDNFLIDRFLITPLKTIKEQKVVGVLLLGNSREKRNIYPDSWSDTDFSFYLTLSNQLANFLETSRLYMNLVVERQELKETTVSKEYVDTVIASMRDGLFVLDTRWMIQRVNRAACGLLRHNEEDLMDKPFSVIFPQAQDAFSIVGGFDHSLEGKLKSQETYIKTKDGELVPVLISVSTIMDQKTGLTHIVCTVKDITDRKRVEDALASAKVYVDAIIASMRDGLFVLDTRWMIQRVNRAACGLLRHNEEDLMDKPFSVIFPQAQDAFSIVGGFDHSLEGKLKSQETYIKTKDGELVPVLISVSTIMDQKTGLTHIVCTVKDITDRKRVEDALASEKERLAVTLRSIVDGVITIGRNKRIFIINKTAAQLTGWEEQEAVGKVFSEVFRAVDEKERKPHVEHIEQLLKSGKVFDSSEILVLTAKNGDEKLISHSAVPIKDKESNITGVVVIFRDITEKRKIEEEISKAHKLESVGILAGGIAHDFNNILTAILNSISVAKMHVTEFQEVASILSEAESVAFKAKDLTQQLLTFSKGGAPIKKIASISDLLKDIVKFTLRGSNVKYELSIAEDLWSAEVDINQISQVIQNLVINADQAMPEGGIVMVEAENLVLDENMGLPLLPGSYIKMSIKDQGVGIAKDYLPKVFDPYFTTKQRGSGLGLTIVYSVIQKHNGYINVESEIGEGTAFNIYLPAVQRAEVLKTEDGQEVLFPGSGRILVMDDEELIRQSLGQLLVTLGYEVEFANDGDEAVQKYYKAKESGKGFDALILDVTVPGGKGGREAIKELLTLDPEVKAIVSSGYSNDPVMARFEKYGFKGVAVKPYKVEDLSRTLHQVING